MFVHRHRRIFTIIYIYIESGWLLWVFVLYSLAPIVLCNVTRVRSCSTQILSIPISTRPSPLLLLLPVWILNICTYIYTQKKCEAPSTRSRLRNARGNRERSVGRGRSDIYHLFSNNRFSTRVYENTLVGERTTRISSKVQVSDFVVYLFEIHWSIPNGWTTTTLNGRCIYNRQD